MRVDDCEVSITSSSASGAGDCSALAIVCTIFRTRQNTTAITSARPPRPPSSSPRSPLAPARQMLHAMNAKANAITTPERIQSRRRYFWFCSLLTLMHNSGRYSLAVRMLAMSRSVTIGA